MNYLFRKRWKQTSNNLIGPAEVKIMDSKTSFVFPNGQIQKVATCITSTWMYDMENQKKYIDSDSESLDSEGVESQISQLQ